MRISPAGAYVDLDAPSCLDANCDAAITAAAKSIIWKGQCEDRFDFKLSSQEHMALLHSPTIVPTASQFRFSIEVCAFICLRVLGIPIYASKIRSKLVRRGSRLPVTVKFSLSP